MPPFPPLTSPSRVSRDANVDGRVTIMDAATTVRNASHNVPSPPLPPSFQFTPARPRLSPIADADHSGYRLHGLDLLESIASEAEAEARVAAAVANAASTSFGSASTESDDLSDIVIPGIPPSLSPPRLVLRAPEDDRNGTGATYLIPYLNTALAPLIYNNMEDVKILQRALIVIHHGVMLLSHLVVKTQNHLNDMTFDKLAHLLTIEYHHAKDSLTKLGEAAWELPTPYADGGDGVEDDAEDENEWNQSPEAKRALSYLEQIVDLLQDLAPIIEMDEECPALQMGIKSVFMDLADCGVLNASFEMGNDPVLEDLVRRWKATGFTLKVNKKRVFR